MAQLKNTFFEDLSRTIKSRLSQRISLGVFLAILVVEAAILIFSVENYQRDRLTEVEREAVVVMRAILRSAKTEDTLNGKFSQIVEMLRGGSVLTGAKVFNVAGNVITGFGEAPGLFKEGFEFPDATTRRRLSDNTRMDVFWPSHLFQTPYSVLARIDTSEINDQTTAFVWRIFGLVLLISVFVTIVTMFVVNKMVLSPILILRQRLTATGEDPNHPEKYIVNSNRTDEFGDVIRAFNQMLNWAGSNLEKIKKNESKLLIAKEVADNANQAKSEFLSSMSHELRTPMNAVLGYGQMLKYSPDEPLSEKQKDYVSNILTGGEHLLELINEVLDLARIEAGKADLVIETVCASTVLDECLSLIRALADERGIEIVIKENFKDCGEIRVDETRLKQALLNLMSNAVKYNHENGKIVLDYHQEPQGMLHISVTDTGSGISEESMVDLFKPFNRLEMDTTIEGTGIGLTITKQIIERMGGHIGVDSEVGTGSTFWIELPLAEA
jgi:signal transduction histidine kinase